MNTKTLKGILLYSLIIILVVAVVFVLVVAIMFIFPNLKLFGYGMIIRNEKIANDNFVAISDSSLPYNLAINVDNFSLTVNGVDTDKISYVIQDSAFGASKVSNASVVGEKDTNYSAITLIEPVGVVSYKNCAITVNVPKNLTYNLSVKSSNANISINELKLNDLNVTTTNGNFYISQSETDELNLNSLFITTSTGNFDFRSKYNTVNVSNGTQINSNKGNFFFNTLNSDISINSKDIYFEASYLYTKQNGFEANVKNIVLKITKLLDSNSSQNSILTSSASIEIDEVKGTTSIKSSNGKIRFGKIHDNCIIDSLEGDVSINEALKYIKVKTSNANINVNLFYGIGNFETTKSGNITCNSVSKNANDFTTITTNSGNITFTTSIAPFRIKSTSNSSISVSLKDLYYASNDEDVKTYEIDAENSILSVNITNMKHYMCMAKGEINSSSGDIRIAPSETPQLYPKTGTPSVPESRLPILKVIGKEIFFATINVIA